MSLIPVLCLVLETKEYLISIVLRLKSCSLSVAAETCMVVSTCLLLTLSQSGLHGPMSLAGDASEDEEEVRPSRLTHIGV